MANNGDYGLICLIDTLDIDGLHIGSVCLGSNFFVVTSFLGCMKWYGGTDEINFEVNCALSTQQSIRDSDGIGFGTFTFFRIVGRVLNEELMMSRSVVRRGSTSAQVSD